MLPSTQQLLMMIRGGQLAAATAVLSIFLHLNPQTKTKSRGTKNLKWPCLEYLVSTLALNGVLRSTRFRPKGPKWDLLTSLIRLQWQVQREKSILQSLMLKRAESALRRRSMTYFLRIINRRDCVLNLHNINIINAFGTQLLAFDSSAAASTDFYTADPSISIIRSRSHQYALT